MRKKIQRPENWQDFESLCRMLWGEIWGIPEKIKKNGRLGQPQAGVDVYGVPKGKTQYSGIQCKGKDDSLKSKLTKAEIDSEVEKAHTFRPALETFIIATTAEKDVLIEQYIREKDSESRANGGFEILLFDWDDISDRMEVHRDTYNYYVLNSRFKSNFDFTLTFEDGSEEITVYPTYQRTTTKYGLKTELGFENAEPSFLFKPLDVMGILHPKENWVNMGWITLRFLFVNTGDRVIENYRLYLLPEKEKVRSITAHEGGSLLFPIIQRSPLYIFEDEKYGVYSHLEDKPMIQKDGWEFEFHLLLEPDVEDLKIEYDLRARDFGRTGALTVKVEPDIVEHTEFKSVEHEIFRREDMVTISGYRKKLE